MKQNIIRDKSFEFSLLIIELYKQLQSEKEFIISNQLLRSATSIGANIAESEAAYSKRDFALKITIAYKEAFETKYWLELLEISTLTTISVQLHLELIIEIIRILSAITKKVHPRDDIN
jgi:four helix bundle protein